jgi:ribonucleoside-diphosphate reductase alpha chain
MVGDSIEGWADSIHGLMRAFFEGKSLPKFDYSDVREKGSRLVTAGGKAPGPAPLRVCHDKILGLLENKEEGSWLTSVEVSDIACFIADAVLSGGIRRAAMIAVFDKTDTHMLHYKSGAWFELSPERARVNVSALLHRESTTEEEFNHIFEITKNSGAGEPGVVWTNDLEWGTNPCGEIALRSMQFCNLTTINLSSVESQEDLEERARIASFLGTLQAGFTDFHYLRHQWEDNSQEEALLGISMTGIGDRGDYREFNFKKAAAIAKKENQKTANEIGIKPAARITCLKPEGTASLVLGTASGVHGRHAPFYIRRFRFKRNESIINYLANTIPALVVENKSDPDSLILELPQKSPDNSIMRSETAKALLKRTKYFHENWVNEGHVSGENKHNVSVTVSVKDNEWDTVRTWMWENRESYSGISLLPYSDHVYVQPPFEDCTEERYLEMMEHIKAVDLSQVLEEEDKTERVQELACVGGSCEI